MTLARGGHTGRHDAPLRRRWLIRAQRLPIRLSPPSRTANSRLGRQPDSCPLMSRGPQSCYSNTHIRIHAHVHTFWICAQRSSVRFGEFRVDCCGSSISPRSHQIPMMSIFQSTGPRSIMWLGASGSLRLEPRCDLLLRRHIPHRSPRSSIYGAGENHGSPTFCCPETVTVCFAHCLCCPFLLEQTLFWIALQYTLESYERLSDHVFASIMHPTFLTVSSPPSLMLRFDLQLTTPQPAPHTKVTRKCTLGDQMTAKTWTTDDRRSSLQHSSDTDDPRHWAGLGHN